MIYNLTRYNASWNTRELRSLGDFSRGKSTHRPRNDNILYDGGGYPFIQTGDIKAAELYISKHEQEYNEIGLAQSKLWNKGTLAITIAANIAETGIISYPMCFPDSVVGFTAYPNETSELYMHYIFAFIRASIQKSVGGSIQDNINIEYLENLSFKIPERSTQDDIVNVLSTLDRKIALNNAINTELEKTAKLLYDYWFVQFDFPNAEGKPYRTSGGEMVYNEQLKRGIPKEWRVDKLESKLSMQRGVEPGSDAYSIVSTKNEPVPFIRVSDLGKTPALFISEDAAKSSCCALNNVLVSFDGSVGKVAIAMKGAYSTGIRKITARDNEYSDALIYFLFQSQEIQRTIAKYAVGSNILHASGAIEHLLVPYGGKIVKAYIEIIEPMFRHIIVNKLQNEELTALRDFLLPLLMNGQVVVSDTATTNVEVAKSVPSDNDAEAKRVAVFKRLVLSAYILDNICDEPTAGRVKFEKLLYLSEYCAQLPLNSEFQRAAAGPYDAQALYSIESGLQKNKWFKRQKVVGESRAYVRMEKSSAYKNYIDTNFDTQQKSTVDKLINLLKTERTTKCEIIATLYGSWNDFLIDGIQTSDEQIVNEVLTNWNKSKERIAPERWRAELNWMRTNGIVPTGYGFSTKKIEGHLPT